MKILKNIFAGVPKEQETMLDQEMRALEHGLARTRAALLSAFVKALDARSEGNTGYAVLLEDNIASLKDKLTDSYRVLRSYKLNKANADVHAVAGGMEN